MGRKKFKEIKWHTNRQIYWHKVIYRQTTTWTKKTLAGMNIVGINEYLFVYIKNEENEGRCTIPSKPINI